MRMKYMYYLLKENYEALENFKIYQESYSVGGTNRIRGKVENWQSTKRALERVSMIPHYKDFCNSILEHDDFKPFIIGDKDSFVVAYETYQEIHIEYENFLEQLRGIIAFCEDAGFDVGDQGFDIKMPPADNLDDFSENLSLLNKAISQCPYLKHESEKIILKKTDIGSIWFEFCIVATGSTFILANLAKIVDKCVKIKSHYVTVKHQEELLKTSQLKNEVLQTVVDANKQIIDATVKNCLEELKVEIPEIKLDHEEEERVKLSLNTLFLLMDKGMEIYASIDSPQEIKDLFPTSDELTSLPKSQELLANTTE